MNKSKNVIISVYDKTNLDEISKYLIKKNFNIYSTGGTSSHLRKIGIPHIEISNYTKQKEILGGRVKTLHPKIHAGILSLRGKKSHLKDLKKHNFEEIDLVISNFYPFEKILKITNNNKKIIENIDIGGPTLVRAAAKNYNDVTVITNPDQYKRLVEELDSNECRTTLEFRYKMSEIAFTETAYYDAYISNYFSSRSENLFSKKKNIFWKFN